MNKKIKNKFIYLVVILFAFISSGCQRLSVITITSEPAGAEVFWSKHDDYYRKWIIGTRTPLVTPATLKGSYITHYIQVRKDGYINPKPVLFNEERGFNVHFVLEPKTGEGGIYESEYEVGKKAYYVQLPQPTWSPQNVAIAELGYYSISEDEAKIISERIHSTIVMTKYFNVVSRSNVELVLAEQEFQKTGFCDMAECLIEMGKILSVEKIVGGSVGRIGNLYLINLVLIDVETGQSEFAVEKEYKGDKSEIVGLARSAAQNLAKLYADKRLEAK